MTITISDSNESLESSTLSGSGLLLDWHDLHDLILELGEEIIHDLVLLDWEGEKVDLLDGADLSVLDHSSELGARDPFFLLITTTSDK